MRRAIVIALFMMACTSGHFVSALRSEEDKPRADQAKEDKAQEEKKQEPNLHPPQPIPVPADKLDAAIRRGVEFLLKDQNKDGSWGGPERTKGLNIYAPVPGAHHAFRGAVTALCVMALIEAGGDS